MRREKNEKKLEFGIIAGSLKGKRIKTPDLGVTRPPLSRLRKSIFDFLNPYLSGAAYLDLFAGTGSYLFEAVSRGAARAIGIDLEPKLSKAINDQAFSFGVADQLVCRVGDAFEAIKQLSEAGERFDIIMIAPPQYKQMIDRSLKLISEHPLLTGEGMILCQHDSSETNKVDFSDFEIVQQRKYGNTTFTILSLPGQQA